jgi:hypothetical protein
MWNNEWHVKQTLKITSDKNQSNYDATGAMPSLSLQYVNSLKIHWLQGNDFWHPENTNTEHYFNPNYNKHLRKF